MLKYAIAILTLTWIGTTARAESTANASANSTATIYSSISIVKTRDLAFGSGAPNDPAKTVAAADATRSATFNVTAANTSSYIVTLPANGTVTMTTGAGGANRTIAVDNFTASVSGTQTGTGAAQAVGVGATRAAIGASQVAGSYSGSFQVTVTYQ